MYNPPTSYSPSLSDHDIGVFVFSVHIQARGGLIRPAYSDRQAQKINK